MTIKRYMTEKDKDGRWIFKIDEFSCFRYSGTTFMITDHSYPNKQRLLKKDKVDKLYDKSNYIMWTFPGTECDNIDYFKALVIERKMNMIKHEQEKIDAYFKDIEQVKVGTVL